RKMVCEWGMSDKLGPLTYGKKEEQPFLGRDLWSERNYSEATQVAIDHEVKRICDDAYQAAKHLLLGHRAALDNLAAALLENATLDGDEIDLAIKGGKVAKVKAAAGGGTPGNVLAPAKGGP